MLVQEVSKELYKLESRSEVQCRSFSVQSCTVQGGPKSTGHRGGGAAKQSPYSAMFASPAGLQPLLSGGAHAVEHYALPQAAGGLVELPTSSGAVPVFYAPAGSLTRAGPPEQTNKFCAHCHQFYSGKGLLEQKWGAITSHNVEQCSFKRAHAKAAAAKFGGAKTGPKIGGAKQKAKHGVKKPPGKGFGKKGGKKGGGKKGSRKGGNSS